MKQKLQNHHDFLVNAYDGCYKPQKYKARVDEIDNCIAVAVNAPSVTPQQKMGRWIEVDICNCHATLKCSVCDRVIEPTFTFGEYSYEDIKKCYPFCHCGAEMRGEEEE